MGVQEPKILILDPGLYCRGLRYIARALAQEIIYAKILRVVSRRKIFKTYDPNAVPPKETVVKKNLSIMERVFHSNLSNLSDDLTSSEIEKYLKEPSFSW